MNDNQIEHDLLQEAINALAGGSSVCFLGAGFSIGAKTAKGTSVPDVSQLCDKIRELANLTDEAGASLTDLAEYCQSDPNLSPKLTHLLVEQLTLCKPSEAQMKILSMPWRAVFTTNFDDVAEVALAAKLPTIVTPAFDVKNLTAGRLPLYYLHGRALDVLSGASDPKIVISETNYLKLKENNRNLYAALENEVHAASKVFFIGYSLRDTEIASRLFAIDGIREKAIVVNRQGESKVTLSRLKKFGAVASIGVDGLAGMLPDSVNMAGKEGLIKPLSFVKQLHPKNAADEIASTDVDRLILAGDFDYGAFALQRRDAAAGFKYCIFRQARIFEVFEAIGNSTNRFIVTSDLGNGKSIFLEQLIFEAHSKGYQAFRVETQLPETYEELDALLSSDARRIFVVDGIVRHRKIATYIGKRLTGMCVLVVTAGGSLDDVLHAQISVELSGRTREIDINTLSSDELLGWNEFLERWGFWEDRIESSSAERLEFLRKRCGSENRSIILSMFKSSRLAEKISRIVEFFLSRNQEMVRAFVAILVNALCRNHVEWERIVSWLSIDQTKFKEAVMASPIADLMSGSRRWYEFTSTELADYILNNYEFDEEILTEVYTRIVRETAYSANDPRSGFDSRENLKELVRFRFLTKLFSKPGAGPAMINAVYHRLSNVPRIRENDQFWLQYAMARMEIGDLDNASTYINTALGLAAKKGADYSNRQILDQRVRLRFRRNSLPGSAISVSEVKETLSDLTKLLVETGDYVIHPLRSSQYILDFLEAKIDDISPDLISAVKPVLEIMKSKLPEGKLEKSQKGETERIRKDIRSCFLILANY